MALGEGIVIFSSQYWGKKQTEPIKKIAAISMKTGLCVAVLLFAAVTLFPGWIAGLFTTDLPIRQQAVEYMDIIRFSYLFFAVTTLLLAAMRSVEVVKIALYLSVMTLVINCGVNYLLIFGNFGMPEMGARGAAVGTLVARIVECIVCIWYVAVKEKRLALRLKDYLTRDWSLAGDYFKVTVPMIVVQALWGLNTALQTVILGHMTAAAIAAKSVESSLFMLVKSMAVGASATASVIIGKTIGSGDINKVKEYAKTLQVLFVCIGITAGCILFLIRMPILAIYDLSAETKAMANSFLIILSVICMTMSYQMPTNTGIIRGGGSPNFVVKLDLISIWGIVLPLSFVMAFVVKASPIVVVCCLNADQVFKCVPAFIKVNYGHWAKKLTR
jgi:putative MATE family efflux protein